MLFLAHIVYLLCLATSLVCMILLVRGYRTSGSRLLLWSALCFVALAVNSFLLFVDLVILPASIDLSLWRTATLVGAASLMLVGFIWEGD